MDISCNSWDSLAGIPCSIAGAYPFGTLFILFDGKAPKDIKSCLKVVISDIYGAGLPELHRSFDTRPPGILRYFRNIPEIYLRL